MPSSPPTIAPAETAHRAFRVFLQKAAALAVPVVALPEIVGALGLPVLLAVPLALAACLPLSVWWRVVARRAYAELDQGCTTLVLQQSMLSSGGSRHWALTEAGPPWDYRGVWVLAPDGRVRSAPDPTVEPPGWYPSPHRADAFELWTGAAWDGHYRPA